MALTSGQITALNFQKFFNAIEPYLNGAPQAGYTPVGTVISVMGNTAPPNYLVCDGTVYNIVDYQALADYFEDQFEASNYFGGDGVTTFAVPDLRGEFLRGTGTNSHTDSGTGNGDGAAVGTHQDATVFPNIYGNTSSKKIRACGKPDGGNNMGAIYYDKNLTGSDLSGQQYVDTAAGTTAALGSTATGKYTARPTNTSVLYCIAVKNIFIDTHDMADTVDAEDVADMIADNPPIARNNYQKYATYEQVIGEWIDGKPIYQKTIEVEGGTVSNNSGKLIDLLTDVNDLFYGVNNTIKDDGGVTFVSSIDPTSGTHYRFIRFIVDHSTNKAQLNLMSHGAAVTYTSGYVTIQYTKTTD